MASGITRRCVGLLSPVAHNSNSALLAPSAPIQARSIYTMDMADPKWKRPPPFDYENKTYSLGWAMIDDSTHRYDDNTKMIVVDGPPTGNKGVFAKKLADAFGMKYIEPCHLDSYYLDDYGRDRRAWNYKLPPKMRSWDVHQFNQKPDGFLTATMQGLFFRQRFYQYADALNHVLSTGQGVVMHRSIYSDHVFGKTMRDLGYIRPIVYEHIEEMKENGMFHANPPHLVVYLDMSPETIIKNAALRNKDNEVGSPFFSVESLTQLNKNYKNYLEKISEHSDVLVYDWNEEVCVDDVIDDICDIDFESPSKFDLKHSKWTWMYSEWDWKRKRIWWGARFPMMMQWIRQTPTKDIPELFPSTADWQDFCEAVKNEPGQRYQFGFNKNMGDKPLFKVGNSNPRNLWPGWVF